MHLWRRPKPRSNRAFSSVWRDYSQAETKTWIPNESLILLVATLLLSNSIRRGRIGNRRHRSPNPRHVAAQRQAVAGEDRGRCGVDYSLRQRAAQEDGTARTDQGLRGADRLARV